MAPRRGAVAENRYSPYESRMEEHGITYTYNGMVPLSSISRYADKQARQRLAGTPIVMAYVNKMKAGEVFPPLVLWEDGTDDYVLLDGNTRKLAHEKLKHTHVDAYIITGLENDNQAIYVSGIFNGINGQPLRKDEVLRAVRAAKLLDPPMSDNRIAKSLGIAQSKVSRIMAAERFDTRLHALSEVEIDLAENAKVALERLDLDPVFIEAVKLTVDADLPVPSVQELVTKTMAATSEPDRIHVINAERAELAELIKQKAEGRATATPVARESMMVMGRLLSMTAKCPDPETWVPKGEEARAEWALKVRDLADFLGRVSLSYDKAIEAGLTT